MRFVTIGFIVVALLATGACFSHNPVAATWALSAAVWAMFTLKGFEWP